MSDVLHQIERVEMVFNRKIPRAELHSLMLGHGFRSIDDAYILESKTKTKPWQTSTQLSVDVFRGSEPIYETEEDIADGEASFCTSLRIGYLLASHTASTIPQVVEVISQLQSATDGRLKMDGAVVSARVIQEAWLSFADELSQRGFPAGSEELAVEIHMFNQRRRG